MYVPPPTFEIITRPVGEGQQTTGTEVKRVQQLLYIAGYQKGGSTTGVWNHAWTGELKRFFAAAGRVEKGFIDPWQPYGDLWALALSAGVIIPLPQVPGPVGLLTFVRLCQDLQIPYGWKQGEPKSVKMLWGVLGDAGWGVFTTTGTYNNDFSGPPYRRLNCTAFANAAMSIWATGGLHSASYTAGQQFGGAPPGVLLGEHYGYAYANDTTKPRKGAVSSVKEIQDYAIPGLLYYVGSTVKSPSTGLVSHEVVLLDGFIHESNLGSGPSVRSTPLDARFKTMKSAILMGPAPFAPML
jgi:hypothetical protein